MGSTTTTTAATDTDGIFCTVPADAFPPGADPVAYVEIDGRPRVIICEDAPLPDVVASLDRIGTHLVRHGIWQLVDSGDPKSPPHRNRLS